VFSKINFRSGWDQLKIRGCDIPKTAFILSNGLYKHTLRSIGLTNALAYLIELMDKIFMECLDKFVIVFIDGILIYSKDKEGYEEHLYLIL
jgi:hypothetical protein